MHSGDTTVDSVRVSVVIPVRNHWGALADTLRSLELQTQPIFEVIVVDDGSLLSLPMGLRDTLSKSPNRLIRQSPLGIAAARNNGMRAARGDMILFTDADCVLSKNCVLELLRCTVQHPGDVAFQMAFVPAKECLVWRTDGISKSAKQRTLKTPSGHIRYLDTGGFAIRRAYINRSRLLFDVAHIQGEDTALLGRLIADGYLPRLVDSAHIEHHPVVRASYYILRRFIAGYRSSPARTTLPETAGVLLQRSGRTVVLRHAWMIARENELGASPFLMLMICYVLELGGRLLDKIIGMRPGRIELLGIPIDCLRSEELQSRILSAADARRPICLTYLTAWSLVQAQTDPFFISLLRRFDIVYSDGMGVVLAALLLCRRRIKKVTANDFFIRLCDEASRRQVRVALVGSTASLIACACDRLAAKIPDLRLVLCSPGYLSVLQQSALIDDIRRTSPQLIVLGMGQPLQETFALRIMESYPCAVLLCVGGLFDYLAGAYPTPPRIVRSCGFEWLWKLIHAPRLMWKRYLIGLPMLLGYLLRECGRSIVQVLLSIRRRREPS